MALANPAPRRLPGNASWLMFLGPWQCHGNRENAIVDAILDAIVGKLRLLNYCVFRFCVSPMCFRVFLNYCRDCVAIVGEVLLQLLHQLLRPTIASNYCIQLLHGFAPFAPYPKTDNCPKQEGTSRRAAPIPEREHSEEGRHRQLALRRQGWQ